MHQQLLGTIEVVVAPKRLFTRLRVTRVWFMAFVISSMLGMTGSFLLQPTSRHLAVSVSTIGSRNGQDPSVKRKILVSLSKNDYDWTRFPLFLLVAVIVTASIMHATSLLAGVESFFSRSWSFAMNVAIISWGFRQLVWGGLVAFRGPESFLTDQDFYRAVPSLAWLTPKAMPKLALILSAIDPFTVWSTLLLALAMSQGLKLNPSLSTAVALVFLLFPATLVAAFGSVQ